MRIFCTLIFLSNDNKIATEEDSTIFKNKKSQGQEHIDLELNIDYDSNYDDRKRTFLLSVREALSLHHVRFDSHERLECFSVHDYRKKNYGRVQYGK